MTQNIKESFHIDFETRSELELTDVGVWAYTHHPSFRIVSYAYHMPGGVDVVGDFWDEATVPYEQFIEPLIKDLTSYPNATICAHNAFFELACIDAILPSFFKPEQFECTMMRAAVLGLPQSLENLAYALKCSPKDKAGETLLKKLCIVRKPSKKDPRLFGSQPSEVDLFDEERLTDLRALLEYNIQDVRTEMEISKKLKSIPEFEERLQKLDLRINFEGFCIDEKLAEGLAEFAEINREKLEKRMSELTEGRVERATMGAKLCEELKKYGVFTSSVAALKVHKLLQDEGMHPIARELLELRQQGSKSSVAKVEKFLEYNVAGKVRGVFRYYGAHTGRWSGKGPQPQNLPALRLIPDKIKEQPLDELIKLAREKNFDELFERCGLDASSAVSYMIRSIIVPNKGKRFFIGDLVGIELRTLFEAAQDVDALKMIETGGDLYSVLAREIYKKEEVTKAERAVGKAAVLGCGYGMGITKFAQTLLSHDPTLSLDDAERLAPKAVMAYRRQYKKVVQLWARLEAAFINCYRLEKTVVVGHFRFEFKSTKYGNFIWVWLPTGRFVSYWKPKVRSNKIELFHPQIGQYSPTWGGSLTENLVQALARDIQADTMLRISELGLPIRVHVHDEIVVEVEQNDIETIEKIKLAFETKRDWYSKHFITEVEGDEAEYYTK